MRPSPNFCAILRIYDYVTPNTVMTALLITQSIEIWCFCINEVVISYTKLGSLHGNVPISCSLQNLFTYPNLSLIFNVLHPLNTTIMQTLQDLNLDLLHTLVPTTLLMLYFSKLLIPPLSLESKISHPILRLSYFKTTPFITPLSRYLTHTSPLHSSISALILFLIIYQLYGNFTCNYLTQPIL